MELAPHDIIQVKEVECLLSSIHEVPDWVNASLLTAPYVVVRRGPINDKFIPIGIRGKDRGQRLGHWIDKTQCARILKPYDLIEIAKKKNNIPSELVSIIRQLDLLFKAENIKWGIGGSFGFSIASDISMYNDNSDLDILLYPQDYFDPSYAQQLLVSISHCSRLRCDIQVQTSKGAFNLQDYATNDKILLKTDLSSNLVDAPFSW